jgi:PAS domain S-box-containing protein
MIPAEAKLVLTEFLLGSDDISQSAQFGLDWLSSNGVASHALCMAAVDDKDHLWGVAAVGISPARTGEFVIDTDDKRNPLSKALLTTRATYFPVGKRRIETPLGKVPFHAIPLRGQFDHSAAGLLLVESGQSRPEKSLLWFASVLGAKLMRLRQRHQATDVGVQRERQLLYSVINAVTDPILLTDAQGKLVIGNTRAEQLLAARGDESEGRRRALEINNLFFSSALAGTTVDQGGLASREVVLVDPEDGSDLLFELLASPVHQAAAETALVSVLRNVTDLGRAQKELEANYDRLRQAEAQVRAERNRLDLIVDSVVDPIIVADPQGDILMTNPPAEKLFSAARQKDPEAERRVGSNVAQFSSFMSSFLLSGQNERMRASLALADPETGRSVPVEAIAAMVLSSQNAMIAVVTVLHDLTDTLERERLYAELKDASSQLEARVQAATGELARQNELLRKQALELEQASTAKSLFLANISHELRTPLHVILGYTWIMQQPQFGTVSDEQRKMIQKVDANSNRLAALINDVLDISRIEAGSVPMQITTFSVDHLVREVMDGLEELIAGAPVRVQIDLADGLPKITSDQQKVSQILVNLITNATKFTHQGEIRVSGRSNHNGIELSVKDTGVGIPEKEHERIFEAFQQAAGTSAKSAGGTGLGLAISRRLARLLGGDLTVQSAAGSGSTFTLTLPIQAGLTGGSGARPSIVSTNP